MEAQRIIDRLNNLIIKGEKVLATRYAPSPGGDFVKADLFHQWHTSCLAFLNSFPPEYIYFHQFEAHCKNAWYFEAEAGVAILRAAKDDIESGSLQKVETIVSAAVFSDFLDMAEHLLDNEYKDPSASLIGAVLEDSLRRICAKNKITVKTREDISSLNQKLAQKQVYNQLQMRQIQVWDAVRNNADHGKFDEYKIADVKGILKGVRGFLSNYLK